MARVAQLEPSQQQYVIKKFRPTGQNNSKSLTNFLNSIEKNSGSLNDEDGTKVEKIMRVDYTGGILGCTLPDLGSFDGINTEHAAIICHESRFFVQDLNSECGTLVESADERLKQKKRLASYEDRASERQKRNKAAID